jgi:hypothetical protein
MSKKLCEGILKRSDREKVSKPTLLSLLVQAIMRFIRLLNGVRSAQPGLVKHELNHNQTDIFDQQAINGGGIQPACRDRVEQIESRIPHNTNHGIFFQTQSNDP